MWDVFANQSESFDSFVTPFLSLVNLYLQCFTKKTSYLRLSLDAQLENGLSKAANGCFCQQECAKCKSTCKCPLLDYYLYTIILCPFVKVVLPKPMPTPDEKSNINRTNHVEINKCL